MSDRRVEEIKERLEMIKYQQWTLDPRDICFHDYESSIPNYKHQKIPLNNETVKAYDESHFLGAHISGMHEPGRGDFSVQAGWFIVNAKSDIEYLLSLLDGGEK